MADGQYVARLVDPLMDELLAELPAVFVAGPRGAGKTTSALRHAAAVARLDDREVAEVFRADPDLALRELPEPLVIDEWQIVPETLFAVKRAVDAESRPGRFILTGSVQAEWDSPMWPGTGRVVRIDMTGLTEREIAGITEPRAFVDRLLSDSGSRLQAPRDSPDLAGYIEVALRGGFPRSALARSPRVRRSWLDSYVDQVVTRDVEVLGSGSRDPVRLRRYFEALALNTAGVVPHKTIYDAAAVERSTAVAYDDLLQRLLVIEELPAWTTNRLKRLVRAPKRFVSDPSLTVGLLGLDRSAVLADSDLRGRLLETFVVMQLRAELPVSDLRYRMYHLRDQQGRHEVDVILEVGAYGVVGIEVKGQKAPGRRSATHLEWLRDSLGDRFLCGLVLHTGQHVYEMAPKVLAAPISVLWGGGRQA